MGSSQLLVKLKDRIVAVFLFRRSQEQRTFHSIGFDEGYLYLVLPDGTYEL